MTCINLQSRRNFCREIGNRSITLNASSSLKNIRWQQRFENFEKSFLFLKGGLAKSQLTPLEVGGVIKAFEMAFELAWKTLKDFIEFQGVDEKFPRDVIKKSFEFGIIENGHGWLNMLERRNQLAHTYDEQVAVENVKVIRNSYFPLLEQVFLVLQAKVAENL